MKNLAESIVEVINEKGVPVQWQEFGMKLSKDAAISTEIAYKIMEYRLDKNSQIANDIITAFDKKLANLKEAQKLLKQNIDDYDTKAIWEELDNQVKKIDIDEIIALLRKDFAIHPFPIILESLKFNWGYMRQNSVRDFYSMTESYLKEMEGITRHAKNEFEKEMKTTIIKPYWLLRSDLLSMEVPMHCDVCRITIAVIIAAKDVAQPNFLVLASRNGEMVRV